MNCTWVDVDNSADERGWRQVRCTRCNFVSAPTPHKHARIFKRCRIPGWGDRVATMLAKIGITSHRIERLFRRPCGCKRRKERLNRIGAWASRYFDPIK